MATQQGNVRINKTIRTCGKRIFFFFVFGEDVAKELRSRKRLLSLNFSWFKKSVEWSTRKFEILSDVRLSLPFAKPIRHHTNSPSFLLLYIHMGIFVVLKSHKLITIL